MQLNAGSFAFYPIKQLFVKESGLNLNFVIFTYWQLQRLKFQQRGNIIQTRGKNVSQCTPKEVQTLQGCSFAYFEVQ